MPKESWRMPEWMESYRHLIKYGDEAERWYCAENLADAAEQHKATVVTSQILLLTKLQKEGILAF